MKTKKALILIATLSLLIVGVGTYIVYNQLAKKPIDEKPITENTNNEIDNNDDKDKTVEPEQLDITSDFVRQLSMYYYPGFGMSPSIMEIYDKDFVTIDELIKNWENEYRVMNYVACVMLMNLWDRVSINYIEDGAVGIGLIENSEKEIKELFVKLFGDKVNYELFKSETTKIQGLCGGITWSEERQQYVTGNGCGGATNFTSEVYEALEYKGQKIELYAKEGRPNEPSKNVKYTFNYGEDQQYHFYSAELIE